jgi:hypothetical protein
MARYRIYATEVFLHLETSIFPSIGLKLRLTFYELQHALVSYIYR